MKRKHLLPVALLAFVGCSADETDAPGGDESPGTSETAQMDGPPPAAGDNHEGHDHEGHDHEGHDHEGHEHGEHGEHGHAHQGPHGGELVELGQEAYHIEMLHDSDAITLYVLGGEARQPVAIAAKNLTVSLKRDGEVNSFELPAQPQSDDAAGKSSRFQSSEQQLGEWMKAGAEGAVVVQIDGKSFTGKIAHDH